MGAGSFGFIVIHDGRSVHKSKFKCSLLFSLDKINDTHSITHCLGFFLAIRFV